MKNRLLLIVICIASSIAVSFSFEYGKPFITSFNSKQYQAHNQNWAVIQDNNGIVYLGNNDGLLICEGFDWTFNSFDNKRIISFCKDDEGCIYAGMDGDFGYLKSDKNGKVNFVSLTSNLEKKLQNFNSVWSCFSFNETEYFCSPERIFIFKDKLFVQAIEASEAGTFHKFFELNNQLWVRQNGIGLQFLTKENHLQLCNGGEFFADKKIDLLHQNNEGILVGTRDNGLLLYAQQQFKQIQNEASELFKKNKLYCYAVTKDRKIACGTQLGGIVIINENGVLEEIIDKQDGLNDNNVRSLYIDRQGFLWAALDKGISLIELNSSFRFYKSKNGLNENVNSILATQNYVYSATTTGIFGAEKTATGIQEFKPIANAENIFFSDVFNVISPDKFEHTILALSQNGISIIKNSKAENFDEILWPLKAIQLKNKEYFVVSGQGYIYVYHYSQGKWQRSKEINYDGISTGTFNSLYESNGKLWIGEKNAGLNSVQVNELINANSPKFSKYKIANNLQGSFCLFAVGNKILTGTDEGIYEFNSTQNKFLASDFLGRSFSKNRVIYSAFNDTLGNIWLASDFKINKELSLKQFVLAIKRGDSTFELVTSPFSRIYDIQINSVFPFSDNEIWFASNDGIFNCKLNYPEKVDNRSIIKEVKIKTNLLDSVIYNGLFLANDTNSSAITILPYACNSMEFSFYSTQLIAASETQYSTWLQGFDEGYSEWRRSKIKSFTNLPEGAYVFHVRTKDIYGNILKEANFKFSIQPPWYRTWWAYLFYFAFGITFIYFLFRILNRELYKKIEAGKVELKEKNKEITDSINYAQTIQQNMLPEEDAISNFVPKSFVHFQPKDIVSGDFYWFADLSKQFPENLQMRDKGIIVLGDCTGHGVPGAFMSMIGIEKLNLAISALPDLNAGKILSFVNVELKKSLKQRGEEKDSKDGMELILCIIDKAKRTVEYSGANRPMAIFNSISKNLLEIKPTKAGIAGGTENEQEFISETIEVKKGDRFYLFSDGMTDQFGGEKNKKITKKGLFKLIEECPETRTERQYAYFENYYSNWMKGYEQTDDMCLIGFEL